MSSQLITIRISEKEGLAPEETGERHLLVAIRDLDIRSDVDGMGECRENSSPATANGCQKAALTP
jgi:hypothetical protein